VKLDGDATANVPDSISQTFSSQGSRLPVEDEEGAARIPMRKISSYVTMAHPHKASDGDVELYWENSPAIPSNEEDYWVEKRCRNEGPPGFNNLDIRRDLFWEWPSDTELQDKYAPILATILQDEVARRQVSVSKIEKNLLTRKLITQKEEGQEQEQKQQPSYDDYWQWDSLSVPSPRHHGHRVVDADSYWEWKSPSAEEEKLQVIERILKAEAHRQMFLVERIEERLITASSSSNNNNRLGCTNSMAAAAGSAYHTAWAWASGASGASGRGVELRRGDGTAAALAANAVDELGQAPPWSRATMPLGPSALLGVCAFAEGQDRGLERAGRANTAASISSA